MKYDFINLALLLLAVATVSTDTKNDNDQSLRGLRQNRNLRRRYPISRIEKDDDYSFLYRRIPERKIFERKNTVNRFDEDEYYYPKSISTESLRHKINNFLNTTTSTTQAPTTTTTTTPEEEEEEPEETEEPVTTPVEPPASETEAEGA